MGDVLLHFSRHLVFGFRRRAVISCGWVGREELEHVLEVPNLPIHHILSSTNNGCEVPLGVRYPCTRRRQCVGIKYWQYIKY